MDKNPLLLLFQHKRLYCGIDPNLNLHSTLTVLPVFPLKTAVRCHHRQGSRVSGTGPHHQQHPAGAGVGIASNQALDSAATLLIEELSNKDRLQSKGGTKQRPCVSLIHLKICKYVSTNQTMIVSKAI